MYQIDMEWKLLFVKVLRLDFGKTVRKMLFSSLLLSLVSLVTWNPTEQFEQEAQNQYNDL